MAGRLDGKAALITGSSKGIGRGIARAYLEEGASVVLNARHEEPLDQAAEELRAETGASPTRVVAIAADVASPESARELAASAVQAFPHLSVLVNNASILGRRATVAEMDVATWDDVLKVNTSSLFYVTQPLIAQLAEQADAVGSSVINVSSSVGRKGKANWGPYAVSKFGLEGFTQVLAVELEQAHVRVNSVNPGATRTDMRAGAYPDEDPMTLPTPADIAEVFVYLASEESRDVTGRAFDARDYLDTKTA